jgi:hypothetical protein
MPDSVLMKSKKIAQTCNSLATRLLDPAAGILFALEIDDICERYSSN